jgi:hypothetical protein
MAFAAVGAFFGLLLFGMELLLVLLYLMVTMCRGDKNE